ncbi:phosphotransferase [Microlunatus speluncae]|uniref:phosphotransferase n=1 Tax=Microlunatus speluncae TaxID=2594267 RepID=UPI001375C1A9|nr:phosphotransferase [Microlunatus speluncae]
MDPRTEVPLTGGHDSGPVVRIGDTVRRGLKPWSTSIHALLQHLERVDFTAAPRFLGLDDHGREILTFIDGADGRIARCYDDEALIATAKLIKTFHLAVSDFTPPPGSSWRPNPYAPRGTLICHNDLGPANTIFRDGRPQAFIDWDLAVPSTALWDLSYAVRTFVPLYSDRDCELFGYEPGRRNRRLSLFCDAYGLDRHSRTELLPTVLDRLESEVTTFARRCIDALQRHGSQWARAVQTPYVSGTV